MIKALRSHPQPHPHTYNMGMTAFGSELQVKPGDRVGAETVLYKRGCGGALFSLVLQGHVNVWAGEDQFHTNVGPWSTIGDRALTDEEYRPDFTAVTDGQCRLLQIRREQFEAAAAAVQSARTGPAQRAVQRRLRRTESTQRVSGGGGSAGAAAVVSGAAASSTADGVRTGLPPHVRSVYLSAGFQCTLQLTQCPCLGFQTLMSAVRCRPSNESGMMA